MLHNHEFHCKLRMNSGNVHSYVGGVVNGLLGLVIHTALYHILTGSDFNRRDNQVNLPVIPYGDTGAITSKLVRQHLKDSILHHQIQ